MDITINELTSQVMTLPPDERAILAQRLWDSLEDFVISIKPTAACR